MLAFREKARPKMNIEVKDKKDFVNIAKKFNIAERHVTKIQDQKLLNMVSYQYFGMDFTSLECLRLRIFWTNFTICQILAEFLVWGKILIVTRNQWRDLWMHLNSYIVFLSKGQKSRKILLNHLLNITLVWTQWNVFWSTNGLATLTLVLMVRSLTVSGKCLNTIIIFHNASSYFIGPLNTTSTWY